MMKKTVSVRKLAALLLAAVLVASQPLSALAAYATLQYGSRGTAVVELQKALLSLGFDPNGTDGKFGAGTREAVKAYQKSRGLTVDGKAGNATLTLLYAEASGSSTGGSTTTTNSSTLKFGSTGSEVSTLQTNLKKLGYFSGTVDGKFGAATRRAVIAFQSANKLTPDGLAGSQTLKLINTLIANGGGSSSGSSSGSTSTDVQLTRTLRRGYTGADVTKVQTRLKELGYYTGTVDGEYGLGSMEAVKRFQERHGLTADGLAGQATFEKLFSSGAIAAGSSSGSTSGSTSADVQLTRTLRRGYTGADVTKVQNRLKELGYLTGTVDGVYGLGTMAAVKSFQQNNGLEADGIAGQATFTKLFASSAVAAGSSTPTVTYTRLEIGSKGDDVLKMQQALKNLNYPTELSSNFDSGTLAAVMLFQSINGLESDGVAGNDTLTLLYSGKAKAYTSVNTAYTPLKQGAKGEDVRKMQSALKALNYPVDADGEYGANTVAAVKLFQGVNGLSADGIAGSATLSLLYSGSARAYTGGNGSYGSSGSTVKANAGASAMGSFTGTNGKKIQLLHWANEIKPSLKTGQNITIYDPETAITFTLYVMSRGRHCDVEPLTAADTAKMMNAWGGVVTWTPKTVYVGLPDGRWTIATMHNVAHGSQVIGPNDFDGQNCVHFLRDMSEAEANDPDYGVTNQKALRKSWKAWTGVTVE